MVLSDTSIRRPVFAVVLSLILVVLGVAAYIRLPVREYPDVDPPVVSISTVYPGASAEIVAREVTQRIEDAISGIEGIDLVDSTSRDGLSDIDVEFVLGRDVDGAAADVRDRVSRVRRDLPDEVEEPVIAKASSDAQAMMWITLTSERLSPLELTDYASRYLVDRLSTVGGVANVIIGGERRYAMRIWLDRRALAARSLTAQDVAEALRRENVELPGGRIESETRELTVRTVTRLTTPEDFRNLVIAARDGYQTRLSEVARVEIGAEDERRGLRVNGRQAVGLGVVRQSQANTVAVADGIREEVERIRPGLPEGVDLTVSYDESVFIRAAIREVLVTFGIAILLVVGVIFVFLRSLRSTLVPAVAIPVSIVASFTVLAGLGLSVNLLTLLSLVLAIGIVVDDAIIVLENISRRHDEGEPGLLAAVRGADQIAFAVVATTIVLVSVFVPLTVMQGDVGRLFGEFGITLAAAVGFSSLVALTLSPMMASKLVSRGGSHGRIYAAFERGFDRFAAGYGRLLDRVLEWRLVTVLAAAAVSALAYLLFVSLPEELAPTEDRGAFIIPVEAPQGATIEYTTRQVAEIETILEPLLRSGEARSVISIVAPSGQGPGPVNRAFVIVPLVPWDERPRNQEAIVESIFPRLLALPGVQAFAVNPPSFGQRGFGRPVRFVVAGPDYEAILGWTERLLERARANPGLRNVEIDYEATKPELRVSVDRRKAADLGLSVAAIGETLDIMLGSRDVTTFTTRGEEYEVILQARDADRTTPADLRGLYVRSADGERLVPLENIVRLEEVGGPPELNRVGRLPAIVVEAALAPDYALGDALDFLDAAAAELLPPEARVSYLGASKEYRESSASLYVAFALALLIVFLVLAAQFESFVHPVVIMAAVPLAVTGGLASLSLGGLTLNIYSQIGLILLIGLMAKNGILVVEFANQLRDEGRPVREAVRDASVIRLRPILMTTIATILGAVPLAFASGAGAEGRRAIGVVIVGGLAFATLLTLFVVPVLYRILAPFTRPAGAVAAEIRRLEAREARDRGGGERKT